jgi:hypothetical protein
MRSSSFRVKRSSAMASSWRHAAAAFVASGLAALMVAASVAPKWAAAAPELGEVPAGGTGNGPAGDRAVGDKPAAGGSAAKSPVAAAGAKVPAKKAGVIRASVDQWRLIDSQSGPVNYYRLMRDAERSFIRGAYQPPYKKAVFGFEVSEANRSRVKRLEWSWRPIKMPEHADECSPKKGDSPAVVYVTWRRMLRWYSLKYVWSASRPTGTICDRRRNAFVAQDTVVLRSGGPLGVWMKESIELAREFRAHFEDGDPDADVPPMIGLGVMTDGDQTKTESTGDYADFVLSL